MYASWCDSAVAQFQMSHIDAYIWLNSGITIHYSVVCLVYEEMSRLKSLQEKVDHVSEGDGKLGVIVVAPPL